MGQDTRNPSLSNSPSPQLKKLLAEPLEDALARNAARCRSYGLTETETREHMNRLRSMVARLTIRLVCKDGQLIEEGV